MSASGRPADTEAVPCGDGAFRPSTVAPGLWRWRSPHPEWRPGAAKNSPADWPREVGSLLWRAQSDGTAVFIDALLPTDREAFWAWADDLVEDARRVLALTTIGFHRRDRALIVERYDASTSRARAVLPAGIESLPLRGAGEVAFWLRPQRALVFGDRVLGTGGDLRLCPQSWLAYLGSGVGHAELRRLLRPLLELPVERVLVSHGEPVLSHARAALAEALA